MRSTSAEYSNQNLKLLTVSHWVTSWSNDNWERISFPAGKKERIQSLELSFPVTTAHFQNNKVRLKCLATIAGDINPGWLAAEQNTLYQGSTGRQQMWLSHRSIPSFYTQRTVCENLAYTNTNTYIYIYICI